jgi:hypothetical protein
LIEIEIKHKLLVQQLAAKQFKFATSTIAPDRYVKTVKYVDYYGRKLLRSSTEAGIEDLEDLPDLVKDDIDNIPSAPFGGAECHMHDKDVC